MYYFSNAFIPALLLPPPGHPLVLTTDLALLTLRLVRVLSQPLGHALLLGASGVGKTLTAYLAAHSRGMPVVHICPEAVAG